MTPAEAHKIRRAKNAIEAVRRGSLILPQDQLGTALDIVTQAAKDAGVAFEDALNGWDPDPRVGQEMEYQSFAEALLDLDEQERHTAVRIAHSMRALSSKAILSDPSLEPTIWILAHDQAIEEVCGKLAKEESDGGK